MESVLEKIGLYRGCGSVLLANKRKAVERAFAQFGGAREEQHTSIFLGIYSIYGTAVRDAQMDTAFSFRASVEEYNCIREFLEKEVDKM